MTGTPHIDSAVLMYEIARYLAAVDVFRAESREPTWLPEWTPSAVVDVPSLAPQKPTRSAH